MANRKRKRSHNSIPRLVFVGISVLFQIGWILLLVLLCVAFLMSCGKNKEPDEAKGELVRSEREENLSGTLLFLS